MFLKHNVCSFVSPTSMAKKTRRVLTWRGWSFLHTPLAKVCTRENDKQPCIRETKYTRKKVLLGYYHFRGLLTLNRVCIPWNTAVHNISRTKQQTKSIQCGRKALSHWTPQPNTLSIFSTTTVNSWQRQERTHGLSVRDRSRYAAPIKWPVLASNRYVCY